MRRALLLIVGLMFFAVSAQAQTADSIIAKYVAQIGGMEKIQAVKTMRTTGKFIGGGGFEAVTVDESKRPNMQRSEFRLQGMTGISAYDGKNGWKIEPWQGKKDAESLSEEEMKPYLESDFDDVLLNYKQKNIKVEYVGMDEFEGTGRLQTQSDVSERHGQTLFYGHGLSRPDKNRNQTNSARRGSRVRNYSGRLQRSRRRLLPAFISRTARRAIRTA
jgi:hypothetical protein